MDDDRLGEEVWLTYTALQQVAVGSAMFDDAAWYLAGLMTVVELRQEQLDWAMAA
jgi:hypothetical protein